MMWLRTCPPFYHDRHWNRAGAGDPSRHVAGEIRSALILLSMRAAEAMGKQFGISGGAGL